jgi:hypothetical protein
VCKEAGDKLQSIVLATVEDLQSCGIRRGEFPRHSVIIDRTIITLIRRTIAGSIDGSDINVVGISSWWDFY